MRKDIKPKIVWPKYCPRCLDPNGVVNMKIKLTNDWLSNSGKRCINCHWPFGDKEWYKQ